MLGSSSLTGDEASSSGFERKNSGSCVASGLPTDIFWICVCGMRATLQSMHSRLALVYSVPQDGQRAGRSGSETANDAS